jgi:hypothetical protein
MFNKIIGGLIMRNLSLVFVLSLLSNVLFAHGNYSTSNYKSDLNIKMWDNSSFIITVDHSPARKTRNFNLKNITPGNHFVKIVKKRRNNHHYGRHGHQSGGFVEIIFQGNIKVPAKKNVVVRVEGKNCLNFKFFKKYTQSHHQHNNGHNHHNNHNGNHHDNGNGYGSSNHYNEWDSGCESTNYNDGHHVQGNYGNHYGPVVMSDMNFSRLVDVIKNEYFDNGRLGIAEQALASNNMNVNQVSIIMDQLTFDKSKLKFAKAAYNKTVDKENYFLINGKFDFSRSVSDLNNFIRHNA